MVCDICSAESIRDVRNSLYLNYTICDRNVRDGLSTSSRLSSVIRGYLTHHFPRVGVLLLPVLTFFSIGSYLTHADLMLIISSRPATPYSRRTGKNPDPALLFGIHQLFHPRLRVLRSFAVSRCGEARSDIYPRLED